MKKYLISALFVLFSGIITAQNFSIGVKDGISRTRINGRFDYKNFDDTKIENKTLHSFGVTLQYKLSKFFAVQTEIDYKKKDLILRVIFGLME